MYKNTNELIWTIFLGGPIFNFIKALGARFTSNDLSETHVSVTTSQGE